MYAFIEMFSGIVLLYLYLTKIAIFLTIGGDYFLFVRFWGQGTEEEMLFLSLNGRSVESLGLVECLSLFPTFITTFYLIIYGLMLC